MVKKEEVKKIVTHLTVTDELTPFHFEFFYDINAEKIVFVKLENDLEVVKFLL